MQSEQGIFSPCIVQLGKYLNGIQRAETNVDSQFSLELFQPNVLQKWKKVNDMIWTAFFLFNRLSGTILSEFSF